MLPLDRGPEVAERLYFEAPYELSMRSETLPHVGLNQVLVRTHASAVSAGTEMLFYRGQAPGDMSIDSTLPALAGAIGYPLRYGYACVGNVEFTGPGVDKGWLGQRVFAFEPHASAFVADVSGLIAVPDGLATEAATLLPNAETATNLLLDGAPLLGERVAVMGAGIVGLLTITWLARFPLRELVIVDPVAERREQAQRLGADAVAPSTAQSDTPLHDFDLVFELSGNPSALNEAIRACGYGGRVVVGSWYGNKPAPLDLGGHYHRNRIQLIGSQVSTLAPALTARWDKTRRIAQAWSLLQSFDVSSLITHRWPFSDAPNAYRMIDLHKGDVLQVLFVYA